jgi:hypothetical protein
MPLVTITCNPYDFLKNNIKKYMKKYVLFSETIARIPQPQYQYTSAHLHTHLNPITHTPQPWYPYALHANFLLLIQSSPDAPILPYKPLF